VAKRSRPALTKPKSSTIRRGSREREPGTRTLKDNYLSNLGQAKKSVIATAIRNSQSALPESTVQVHD
jgi:hypothetical protein